MSMYEENLQPLPEGDAASIFREELREIQQRCGQAPSPPLTPESVLQWGDRSLQPPFAAVCRRLLLPGSRVEGFENLAELMQLSQAGKSCLICLNHRSNLDVPTLYTLLSDQAAIEVFHRTIWVSGRKLAEDAGLTSLMLQAFNRVILTPHSWFAAHEDDAEQAEAHRINMAAKRTMLKLRRQGWVFALFPSGTRERPDDPASRQAIEETDSYLKFFDYFVLGHIAGCTLPVSRDDNLTHETPCLDRVVFTFSTVMPTDQWRADAQRQHPHLSQRAASALQIMSEITALADMAH
jgi:glycerol-3-phosphate O-acyltransferase